MLDDYYADEPERRPRDRIVELPDTDNPVEFEAIRDFTHPCILCVPGARDSWALFPLDFENPYENEEHEDGEHEDGEEDADEG